MRKILADDSIDSHSSVSVKLSSIWKLSKQFVVNLPWNSFDLIAADYNPFGLRIYVRNPP